MKAQNTRGGKNTFSGSATGTAGSHQTAQSNGQRKNAAKYTGGSIVFSNNAGASESHDRLLTLLASATGKTVVATVSSGARYRGILSSLSIGVSGEDALSIVLVKPSVVAKSLINEKSNVDQGMPGKMVIESKDLIDVEVAGAVAEAAVEEKSPDNVAQVGTKTEGTSEATPGPETRPETATETTTRPETTTETTAATVATAATTTETTIPAVPAASSSFRTDRDISSRFNVRERELERWVPDGDSADFSLEDTADGEWDQFKANERRFGVESSYDEHLYTTKINRSTRDYRDRLARAERLAREIQGSVSSDRHVMEERGATVDDSGMDEEDRYSGVIQDTAPAAVSVPEAVPEAGESTVSETVDPRGNELMAALRNASISKEADPAPASNDSYGTPRHRAAEYHNDPAIISSSATRTRTVVPGQTPVEQEKAAAEGAPGGAAGTSTSSAKPPAPEGEAFRLNAQSEFNALREFSANFKIPHKIPNDLLPILAKDKLKQDEILRKQETKNGNHNAPSAVNQQPKAASPASAKSDVPAEPKKEATKFKLNPKAAAFTPSRPPQMSPVPAKAVYNRSPSVASPRLHNTRPYSNSSSGSSGKRHNQITPAEFFGGADKVPTPESQKKNAEFFKSHYNFYAAAIRRHADKPGPVVFEKAFKTPPTWDSTTDETYDKMIARNSAPPTQVLSPVPHFMGSPMMPNGVPPMMPVGYMGAPGNGKYPMSPQFQQPMVQFQQPFHPSMMYPQFQGGMPLGQPQMMYAPPGVDPSVLPPQGYMMPGYVGSPNPMNGGGSFQGANPHSQGGSNSGQHYGGRRQNQGRKGSNANDR